MIDIRSLRADPEALDRALLRRGQPPAAEELLRLDTRRREVIRRRESLLAERNRLSAEAGRARAGGDLETFARLRDRVQGLRDRQDRLQTEDRETEAALRAALLAVPNPPHADSPDGADERASVEIRRSGPMPEYAFPPREHFEIGESLGLMDFERATALSGSRFVVLRGALARLHQALGRFMLDRHVQENGYEEIWVPSVLLPAALEGTGQLPKFENDLYPVGAGGWLSPTAEVPLTNLVRERILAADELPQRLTAWTPCFRSEAGAAGQDTRGMLRQHQFEKVELVSVTRPEDSAAELERMTGCAEGVLQALGLPFRTVELATGDLGFAAHRTYDLEVWLPGQGRFREISSCSNCDAFQARRMNARFRPAPGQAPVFPHTLNGSGVAIGRALIAVLEVGQQADGGVTLPAVLAPHMGGARSLRPDGTLSPDPAPAA